MSAAITTKAVSRASAELAHMRSSLVSWLRFRTINDAVMAGTLTTTKPRAEAQATIRAARSVETEQDLADKLHALLEEVMPDVLLPNVDLRSNPNAAVQLAQIAITGNAPVMQSSPSALGMIPAPWIWPVVIVGGVLILGVVAIRSAADVAKDEEEKACIRAGACTDYGFWLRSAAAVGIAWFAWEKLGVGDRVKKLVKGRS